MKSTPAQRERGDTALQIPVNSEVGISQRVGKDDWKYPTTCFRHLLLCQRLPLRGHDNFVVYGVCVCVAYQALSFNSLIIVHCYTQLSKILL